MALCKVCNTALDPFWAGLGVDMHPTCQDYSCTHGEPKGPRYCALCKRKSHIPGQTTAYGKPPVERNVAPVGMAHPITARAAADRALPNTGSKRRMVLDAIRERPDGLCDWELEHLFQWKHESASACRRSLVKDGWLKDSGRTRKVPDTGNPAIVWIEDL